MDGQMSIFDFPEFLPEEKNEPKSPAEIWSEETGISDYWSHDIVFVDAKPVCKHSNHSCNRKELWKIAESFDDITCPQQCCRKCSVQLCGARCNGSEEPKTKEVKTPCMRECDVEWCSIACFEKRGQIYDKVHREWYKDSEGNPLIRDTKECDWSPKAVPVEIKGICDDGYCPKCNVFLDDLIEKCPYCGTLLDWTHWKIINDMED